MTLHDETIAIDHRAATGTPDPRAFEEEVVEVAEVHEEPVVRKVVRPGEEVVVRKEGHDRMETVRDTVRESRVEVDRAAAGDKPIVTDERHERGLGERIADESPEPKEAAKDAFRRD